MDTFPSLPGLSPDVIREPIREDKVYTSASGKEERTTWWTTARFRFTLTYNVLRTGVAAPSPWGSDSEVGVILHFFDNQLGRLGSFYFVDPLDGTTRTVRFDQTSIPIQQIVPGAWKCTVKLISVI